MTFKARKNYTLDKHFEACGKIFWLWSNSDLHKSWPVSLQTRFVLPAVLHGQYCIIEEDAIPKAYCSWAHISLDVEERFVVDPNSLEPTDWLSGDRLWFIDWISPFGTKYTWELQRKMARRFPDDVGRALRVKPNNPKARVATFTGSELTRDESHAKRNSYFKELIGRIRSNTEKS